MFRKLDPYLLLVVLLSLFSIGPLLQPGYFWEAHDARHSVYFMFELDRSIQDGVLYPRWQPDFAFGYGYPFFNIYGPLASYAGEAWHLLGFGFADSVKIVFGLSVVASGLAMYWLCPARPWAMAGTAAPPAGGPGGGSGLHGHPLPAAGHLCPGSPGRVGRLCVRAAGPVGCLGDDPPAAPGQRPGPGAGLCGSDVHQSRW